MRRFVILAAVVSITGCTTLRPIDGTAPELQQRIASGELLQAGDRVVIVTTDAKTHKFVVTEIREGIIKGNADSVVAEQIVTVEKRQFSRARTLALVAGILIIGGLIIYGAAQVAPAAALE